MHFLKKAWHSNADQVCRERIRTKKLTNEPGNNDFATDSLVNTNTSSVFLF